MDDIPYYVGSGRSTPSSTPKYEGFVGKYLKRPWDSIKSGYGKASKWIANNKNTLLATAGGATQAFGAITGNPVAYAAGTGLRGVADAIKEGEAKKALEKAIVERQPNPYSNRNIVYSDIPRIHYSRKPAALKISQKKNIPMLTYDAPSSPKVNKDKKKKEPKQKQKQKLHLPPSRKTDPGFWADLRAATKKYNERHEKAYKEFESGDW